MTKKEYLEQIQYFDLKIKVSQEEIENLESVITYVSPIIRDFVNSSTKTKKDDLICKILDFKDKIIDDINYLVELRENVFNSINAIEDVRARTILMLRYLEYKTWDVIAEQMNYSIRNVHRIHNMAIDELVIECLI